MTFRLEYRVPWWATDHTDRKISIEANTEHAAKIKATTFLKSIGCEKRTDRANRTWCAQYYQHGRYHSRCFLFHDKEQNAWHAVSVRLFHVD